MGNYINREITNGILADFFQGKVIIIAGPRQVGKTTLVESVLAGKEQVVKFVGDNPTDREKLENKDFEQLDRLIGDNRYIFIDEAQKIRNIGQTLKLLVDNYASQKQVIATGSSSLNLLSNTQEPLTGRKYIYELFGFSLREIFKKTEYLAIEKALPDLLIYGSYPEVYLKSGKDRERLLVDIAGSYLYKDILELEQVRNPAILSKLLSALALQTGLEVSLSELSSLVGLDLKTIERYIDLLEKNYVIFRLPPYYLNQRKTLSKRNKIFFYDLGIRNALINNFNALDLRSDVGELWENFLILERFKYRRANFVDATQYFWRTYDGAEIDLVEQREGKLFGYEFKWGKERTAPFSWLKNPNSEYKLINKNNFIDFLMK
ncbi:ATPase [Candidatus Woesebacteria bacterium CG22_combo_CG10-13_8_21_14_all_39_10]|uniref:ATPase n=3 Tax=Candidatus Woeseibacteriota TaxID=1752722 RepID=A0A2M7X9V2_9BACT|nr:MAG: ATPase [Candidatus Woesebacteria bacterium CG22_combo_CG10-13_8_21_14_all_39_10]PIZ47577.1 MAG: ATPase [Candidatus Woesebacteria bacterium CG_4_10_14_0_2_um_filter_39_14]PJA42943.1 MAG: ATPase [Candidatus Woesebacteria bacterium CG_4_9_14_3_um_filter_39_10]